MCLCASAGSSYLELQRDMSGKTGAYDAISLDWSVDMAQARKTLGPDVPVQGNIDPVLLLGNHATIDKAIQDCIAGAGGPGQHILNLGHGILQPTPEANVQFFVDSAKRHGVRT